MLHRGGGLRCLLVTHPCSRKRTGCRAVTVSEEALRRTSSRQSNLARVHACVCVYVCVFRCVRYHQVHFFLEQTSSSTVLQPLPPTTFLLLFLFLPLHHHPSPPCRFKAFKEEKKNMLITTTPHTATHTDADYIKKEPHKGLRTRLS